MRNQTKEHIYLKVFKLISVLILFAMLAIQCLPIYASHDLISGKIQVTSTHQNQPTKTEFFNFYKYNDQVRLNFNEIIYYVIDITQEKIQVVNDSKKTITQANVKDYLRFIPPPLFIFQNPELLENYFGKDNIKIHFINREKSTKIKVVSFKFNSNNYELYLKNNNVADKLVISNPSYQVTAKIMEYAQSSDKNGARYFKPPDNYKKTDLNKLKRKK